MSTSAGLRFWLAVSLLLASMAAVQFTTARQESQIYDESSQILSGYSYLKTGRYTIGLEHPPALKLLFALAVAPLNLRLPDIPHPGEDIRPAGRELLYHNRAPADSILMAGRSVGILVSILLGAAIAFWARRHFGSGAAVVAVSLYACDPNFIAHGRYIKNDVAVTLLIFAAVMTWGAYILKPSRPALLVAGLMVGLALATKSSALILPPVMAMLYAIRRWQEPRAMPLRRGAQSLAAAGFIAFLVIFTLYRFEVRPLGPDAGRLHLGKFGALLTRIPVPAVDYIRGLFEIEQKQTKYQYTYAYLPGEHSKLGWWFTSPLAFAVKTPVAELALLSVAAALAFSRLRRVRIRAISFRWFLLAVPAAAYFFVSLFTHFNAGLRHLLPVYPFLFVFIAGILLSSPAPPWRLAAVAAAAVVLVIESACIHPHYLAFFNVLAGGPAAGPRYLVDSNLDWGQDVKNLKRYLDSREIPEVAISYFGAADLDYYGIAHHDLPDVPDAAAVKKLDCVAAISVSKMEIERARYAGLTTLRPDARVGYSIYVYDLRKRRRDSEAP